MKPVSKLIQFRLEGNSLRQKLLEIIQTYSGSKTNRFPVRCDVELLFLEKYPPFIEDKSQGLFAFIISLTY